MGETPPSGPYDDTVHASRLDPTLQAPSSASRPTARVEPPLPAEAVEAGKLSSNVQGEYVRVKRVGAGGMGEVWRAWDRALKDLEAARAASPNAGFREAVEEWIQEARKAKGR